MSVIAPLAICVILVAIGAAMGYAKAKTDEWIDRRCARKISEIERQSCPDLVAERLRMWDAEQDQIAACGSDPARLQAYKVGLQERTKGNPYLVVLSDLSDSLRGLR